MLQLIQNLRSGEMQLLETPMPALGEGSVLVRCAYSLISAGTEGKRVYDARLGYVAKARARKKEVNQILQSIRVNGLQTTYRLVSNKLDTPAPMGYSCAGEVVAVGASVRHLRVGDKAACGGGEAAHAEMVAAPMNLCVRVPDGAPLEQAAFTTIGAIAMQGVRQADLRLGESCAVIGLGLVGQLTMQILQAAGVRTIGIDIEARAVELASALGANLALVRSAEHIEASVVDFSAGFGVDAVIIAAGAVSLDPIELAGRLCRQKGRVVVVGSVPTGFSREQYYRKELELRMSCSYGPGRYDDRYEQKGIDYPIGYVRWTENRNLAAFVQLLADGKLHLDRLITHRFPFEQAPHAYDLILQKQEFFVGVLLEYDTAKPLAPRLAPRNGHLPKSDQPKIGLIGAGSFAQNVLLPFLRERGELIGVATAHGHTARHVADKYGFSYSTCDADQVLDDPAINTVFIATRHNLHAPLALAALQKGKHVFVEKPLCMNEAELEDIRRAYEAAGRRLLVGFNRRFAPFIQQIKSRFPGHLPKAIAYRINAGAVASDHWVHDPHIGGGRIIGEVCHFVDLAQFLAGAAPVSVSACALDSRLNLQDTVVVNLSFANGSAAAISYFSNGSKQLGKEHLEVFCAGQAVIIDDFRELRVFGAKQTRRRARPDKGHQQEVAAFLDSIKTGGPSPIPFQEIYDSTLATFKILDSLRMNHTIRLL
jgi:polar amino acid transport system substrate-binding protein